MSVHVATARRARSATGIGRPPILSNVVRAVGLRPPSGRRGVARGARLPQPRSERDLARARARDMMGQREYDRTPAAGCAGIAEASMLGCFGSTIACARSCEGDGVVSYAVGGDDDDDDAHRDDGGGGGEPDVEFEERPSLMFDAAFSGQVVELGREVMFRRFLKGGFLRGGGCVSSVVRTSVDAPSSSSSYSLPSLDMRPRLILSLSKRPSRFVGTSRRGLLSSSSLVKLSLSPLRARRLIARGSVGAGGVMYERASLLIPPSLASSSWGRAVIVGMGVGVGVGVGLGVCGAGRQVAEAAETLADAEHDTRRDGAFLWTDDGIETAVVSTEDTAIVSTDD